MNCKTVGRPRGPIHWILLTLLACSVLAVATSFAPVRAILVYPLLVHDNSAHGEAAYVMADGYAYWARLRVASDLYHMRRVPRIFILDESFYAGHDFVGGRLETQTERAIRFLKWHGVPAEAISLVPIQGPTTFGSLSEARSFAKLDLPELKDCVVVTSAPHTRRSRLCFRRSLPSDVRVHCFATKAPRNSEEIYHPIWIEYVKLAIYFFVA